mmetsp:Transcript_23166/g.42010  ORF Transcript_23166/g.42010 Transcript_23166/m.42010 type:complete len:83 (+) Transcript_23166:938-1186(+)
MLTTAQCFVILDAFLSLLLHSSILLGRQTTNWPSPPNERQKAVSMSTLLTVTNILWAVDDSCIQFAAAGGFQVILDTFEAME